MNWRIIGILAAKDLSLFFRKKGIVALTIIGLVFYLVIYFVMPSTVNEDLEIGVYAPGIPPVFQQLPEEGLEITYLGRRRARRWSEFRSYYVGRTGVLLSPFSGPHRLENFRGHYLLLGPRREEVIEFVRAHVSSKPTDTGKD